MKQCVLGHSINELIFCLLCPFVIEGKRKSTYHYAPSTSDNCTLLRLVFLWQWKGIKMAFLEQVGVLVAGENEERNLTCFCKLESCFGGNSDKFWSDFVIVKISFLLSVIRVD